MLAIFSQMIQYKRKLIYPSPDFLVYFAVIIHVYFMLVHIWQKFFVDMNHALNSSFKVFVNPYTTYAEIAAPSAEVSFV